MINIKYPAIYANGNSKRTYRIDHDMMAAFRLKFWKIEGMLNERYSIPQVTTETSFRMMQQPKKVPGGCFAFYTAPSQTVFDEVVAITIERGKRLWDDDEGEDGLREGETYKAMRARISAHAARVANGTADMVIYNHLALMWILAAVRKFPEFMITCPLSLIQVALEFEKKSYANMVYGVLYGEAGVIHHQCVDLCYILFMQFHATGDTLYMDLVDVLRMMSDQYQPRDWKPIYSAFNLRIVDGLNESEGCSEGCLDTDGQEPQPQ